MKDQLPGGKADKNQPSDYNSKQLAAGIKVEMEHTNDKVKAKEIAMDHLAEDPDYYKDWDNKEKILFQEKVKKGGPGSGRRGNNSELANHITWTLAEYTTAKDLDDKQDALAKIEQIENYLNKNPEQDRQEFRDQIKVARMKKSIDEIIDDVKKAQGVPEGADPATHERCVQHLKDQGHDKSSAYAICNAAGAGKKSKKKSKESNMKKSIEEQMDDMAENMAKSTTNPIEQIKETIKTLGSEGIKKAMPNLSDEQKELLSSVLVDMKKAVEMDANYAAPRVRESIMDTKYDVDKADDDADEKLVIAAAAQHNHQGDVTPEGRDGHIIKSELDAIRADLVKSYEEAGLPYNEDILKSAIKERYLAKANGDAAEVKKEVAKETEKEIKDIKEESKKEVKDEIKEKKEIRDTAKDEVKSHEKKMHKSDELSDADAKKPEDNQVGDGSKGTEGSSRADKEDPENLKQKSPTNADEVKVEGMKKSVSWESPDAKLRAMTGGRNHHFSVNGYYDEVIAKSKEEENTEDVQKSEAQDINDVIEKGLDMDQNTFNINRELQKHNANGHKSSFNDMDMATAFNMTEDEMKEILGE